MENKYQTLEKKINIRFKDKRLLTNAFVHRSYLNEHKGFPIPSNERLEFLGDSVLSLITSVYLFKNYPALKEGDYTDIKSAIVKKETLAQAAENLNLGQYLFLSKGEEKEEGRKNKNILADVFEALIGCIFLDQGFETTYRFVCDFLFIPQLNEIVNKKLYLSSKTRLQEYIQAKYKKTPLYKLVEEKGPAHRRWFKVAVYFNQKQLGVGGGASKKEAEEMAAKNALQNLKLMI
jgi:ribonuclease-3